MGNLLARLRPTDREIYELALRETDPREYSRFTPITHGSVFAIVGLAAVGIAAIVCTPFWLLRRRR